MAIEVEKMIWPGYGVLPALLDRIVMDPFVNFRKGIASDTN
jgi:hypothetical protein